MLLIQQKTTEVSKTISKEKRSNSKDTKQPANGAARMKDKKKSEGQGKVKKLPPVKKYSDSDVSAAWPLKSSN